MLPADMWEGLSDAAVARIKNAYLTNQRICEKADAQALAQFNSDSNCGDFLRYRATGQLALDIRAAKLEGIFIVCRAFLEEYQRNGKSVAELREIMWHVVDGCVDSAELDSSAELNWILLELGLYESSESPEGKGHDDPPQEAAVSSSSKSDTWSEISEPPIESKTGRRKPGPARNTADALKVQKVICDLGEDHWTLQLDRVCELLDNEGVRTPSPWKRKSPPILSWEDAAVTDRSLAKKAIINRLKIAKSYL